MASTAHRSGTHLTPSRANFMMLVLTTLLGVVGLGYISVIFADLWPPKGAGSRLQDLGAITDADIGGVQFQNGVAGPFIYDTSGRGDVQGLYAVRTSNTPGKIDALLGQTCTHLGCPVAWTAGTNTFNCPCHGSVFDKSGQRTAGPAPAPLRKFKYSYKGNHLIVEGRES